MRFKKYSDKELFQEVLKNLTYWKPNSSQDASILSHFQDESQNIEDLLTRTLKLGESNSLLVIGPRGCGKTTLLSAIIQKLKSDDVLGAGIIVHLNGLLQIDDRLALQEITRQLHLSEESAFRFGSFAENLNFILKTFQSGSRESSKPIILILDEFDLFCHHRNQTLLYNLFDISQSAQAPVCVIGLTARLDVIELLEKRVKSRFSHRQIFLFPPGKFEKYLDIARSSLQVTEIFFKEDIGMTWNKNVDRILQTQEVVDILKRRFMISTDIRNLKEFLFLVMAQLDSQAPLLTLTHFKQASTDVSQDSKRKLIQDLSVLQLSLLVAMKHLDQTYDGEPFNFEMVYRQYSKFGEKFSSTSSYERAVVFKAFDELECLELLRPVEQNRHTTQREYRLMQLLVLPHVIQEVIQTMPNLPTFLFHWCTSNVL